MEACARALLRAGVKMSILLRFVLDGDSKIL